MTSGKTGFPKEERLCSKKGFEQLFETGNSFYTHPFRVIWMTGSNQGPPAKIAIAVPKRIFKKAVDRNLIRRRIREAYRLQKKDFLSSLSGGSNHISFMIIYQEREILSFQEIYPRIERILQSLLKEVAGKKG